MCQIENLANSLLEELRAYINVERSVDEFPNDVSLGENQSVDVILSTFSEDRMIYIWEVRADAEPHLYIGSEHGDGGVTVFCAGPWSSLNEAQDFYGECSEGWS
jgi:hypothetical protein